MKILLVSSFLPYPLFSGGHIRLYNLIKYLSKRHEITLICEKRTTQSEKDIEKLKEFCKTVITVKRKKQWSTTNILMSGFSMNPFLIVGHTLPEMKQKITEQMQKEKFDLVHVETSYVFQNIPTTNLPIILVEHNIEYLVYKRFADHAFFLIRPFLYIDVQKLKNIEKKFWKQATRLVAVSEEEKKIMERDDVVVIANGVDTTKYQPSKKTITGIKRLLFIGDFKWVQNRNTIRWILQNIFPLLQKKIEKMDMKVRLWVVGKDIPEDIKKLGDNRHVDFDENAPSDTAEIYAQSYLLLAPIRVGGGTQYKILECMASGVPVITTSLGAEGLGAKDQQEILIANNPESISGQIVTLLESEDLYEKIARNARQLIEEKYDWENIAKKLDGVYRSVK